MPNEIKHKIRMPNGALRRVADLRGISRQAVWNAVQRGNEDVRKQVREAALQIAKEIEQCTANY